jgi:hypothetical protein
LSTVVRGKCLDALPASPLTDTLVFSEETAPLATLQGLRRFTAQLYAKAWIVYAKRSLAGPEHVLDYLSRYTHRVAIANHRIVDVQDGQVRFPSRHRRQGKRVQTMTLAAYEFIRRFLLYVIPRACSACAISASWPTGARPVPCARVANCSTNHPTRPPVR